VSRFTANASATLVMSFWILLICFWTSIWTNFNMANITQNRRSNKKYISNRTSLISLMMANCSCKNQFPISKASLTLLLDTQFLSDVSISLSKIVNFILINRYHGVLSLTNAFIVGSTPRNYWQNLERKNLENIKSRKHKISNENLEKISSVQIQKGNFKKLKFKIYFINLLGRKCEKTSSNLTINASVWDVFDYCWFIFFHLYILTIFDISSDIY
jgi:uncharacterized protein YcfL